MDSIPENPIFSVAVLPTDALFLVTTEWASHWALLDGLGVARRQGQHRGWNVGGAGYGARMSSYTESQLRDLLADNLALIEPGLRLVKPEFWLKNADGVKGSIDLLAQDRHGMYVVIELKVSQPSGRKTVAQVMKYVRLLEDNGKSRKEIRAIIVSTTWREMLTTISEFARTQIMMSVDIRLRR